MPRTAHITCTVHVQYTDNRGRDCDATVDVDYTFDGEDDVQIQGQRTVEGGEGIGDWEFDELVWEAVSDRARDDYNEWYHERAEYLRAARADRLERV